MRIAIDGFSGASQAPEPKLLPNNVGVESVNHRPGRGDLRGWKLPLTVATVGAARRTIYRMGRDVASDALYWLSWTTIVHAVRGFDASDPTERTYFTGSGTPKVTDNVIGLAGGSYPTSARELGVPVPTLVPTLTQTVAGTGTASDLYACFTYVTDEGEESAPSPPSALLVVAPGASVQVANLGTSAPGGNYGITLKRVYLLVTGARGSAEWFFFREVAIGTASVSGAVSSVNTSDVLATQGSGVNRAWLPPPADLKHLHGLWNGMMAGISGRSVRYCEPYAPYAYPLAYETVLVDVTPVALASYQQTLLVLTTGRPSRVEGTSPDAMQDQTLEFDQACISETSVQSFGHGAAWASPDGLAYMGVSGPRVLTAGLMLREDWQALNPSTIVSGQYEGLYVGFYTQGTVKGFMIDPLNPTGIYFLETGYSAAYFDRFQDALYVLDGTNVRKWHADATSMTARFRSKVFAMPKPINMGCAEVVANSYPVTFRLYADGVLRHTRSVTNRRPFNLPSGYLADDYQIEVEAPLGRAIQGVAVAETVKELAGL